MVVEVVEIALTIFVDVNVIWDVVVTEGVLVWVTVVLSSDVIPDSVDVDWKVIYSVITVVGWRWMYCDFSCASGCFCGNGHRINQGRRGLHFRG